MDDSKSEESGHRCYVCGRLGADVYLGKGVWRHRKHGQRVILRAAQMLVEEAIVAKKGGGNVRTS